MDRHPHIVVISLDTSIPCESDADSIAIDTNALEREVKKNSRFTDVKKEVVDYVKAKTDRRCQGKTTFTVKKDENIVSWEIRLVFTDDQPPELPAIDDAFIRGVKQNLSDFIEDASYALTKTTEMEGENTGTVDVTTCDLTKPDGTKLGAHELKLAQVLRTMGREDSTTDVCILVHGGGEKDVKPIEMAIPKQKYVSTKNSEDPQSKGVEEVHDGYIVSVASSGRHFTMYSEKLEKRFDVTCDVGMEKYLRFISGCCAGINVEVSAVKVFKFGRYDHKSSTFTLNKLSLKDPGILNEIIAYYKTMPDNWIEQAGCVEGFEQFFSDI